MDVTSVSRLSQRAELASGTVGNESRRAAGKPVAAPLMARQSSSISGAGVSDLRRGARVSLGRASQKKHVVTATAAPEENCDFDSVKEGGEAGASAVTSQWNVRVGEVLLEGEKSFKKVLAANRGEIAVRVFRAASELGASTVAVYSPQDRLQPHRYKADESYCVGEGKDYTPVGCYLAVDDIVELAVKNGVDAIHPGYGFLSERADFAQKCADNGITFVGPRPETLGGMGDKTAARDLAIDCGVPIIPGTPDAVQSLEEAQAFTEQYGFPVILKAAMGGGGRGMRVVREEEELADLFNRATSEAEAAFGDGRVFIEKFIGKPRHIEVQILADMYGNVVHLHERDCSVQRRHQKVIEMAPAMDLKEETRQAIFDDAIKLAKHINYLNAGTVEFLVDEDGSHYFIEVNPRIQVEHTVTEEITGIDLVQSQIRIAAGASLPELGINSQLDIQPRGVAIQCRITTEDPTLNFQPDSGKLEAYRIPGGMGVRIDGSVDVGSVITPYYDSLLVKLTCHAADFKAATRTLYRGLTEFRVRGVKTNIPFLQNVLTSEEFLNYTMHTNYVDNSPNLFDLAKGKDRATKLLSYLAELVVNGPDHPGAIGPPPSAVDPVIPACPEGPPADGWMQVLEQEGPEGLSKAIRAHKGLLLTDTTMRDAHQSLLATRMRTHDMLKVAPQTAHYLSNAFSLEVWGGATFDVAMRFLHECPWDRLERLRAAVPNVPFQMLLRGTNAVGYTAYPDNVVKAFVKEARKRGVDIFRVFDSLNYLENLKFGIEAVHEANGVVEATICYTGDVSDPTKTKYDLDYYVNLVGELVNCPGGIHILAIKDMAGLLKPRAATMLVSAIREKYPDLPIHVHTHDTAGVGVAAMLAAAEAGADIVDCAVDSMSGLTSQPSMGALVASTTGTALDTGISMDDIPILSTYWEQVRGLYSPYECTLKAGSSDVYVHEMPGGQFTNLKFQATSLGLGDQWDKVKTAYASANRLLGDIVKVTPSSKVVGDMAQLMVSQGLDEEAVLEQASTLSYPQSVVEYFQGYLGQPYGGFPPLLRAAVVGDKDTVVGRPGASMEALSFRQLKADINAKHPNAKLSEKDVLSAAIYPQVFDDYLSMVEKYSDLGVLPTRVFLEPLKTDQEVAIEVQQGKTFFVRYKAKGELKPDGTRTVFFDLNGLPRTIEVDDRTSEQTEAAVSRSVKEKADASNLGSVGAPMAGDVLEMKVKTGDHVNAGDALVVLTAMKMETTVSAPISGRLQHVACQVGDQMKAGELLCLIGEDGEEEEGEVAGSLSVPKELV